MTASCASAVLLSALPPPQAVSAAVAAATPQACKKERREIFLSYKYIFLTFRRAVLHRTNGVQCCHSYFYTPHRNSHARGLSALGIRRFSHKMTILLYHCNKSVSSCFLKDIVWKRANNRVLCSPCSAKPPQMCAKAFLRGKSVVYLARANLKKLRETQLGGE